MSILRFGKFLFKRIWISPVSFKTLQQQTLLYYTEKNWFSFIQLPEFVFCDYIKYAQLVKLVLLLLASDYWH